MVSASISLLSPRAQLPWQAILFLDLKNYWSAYIQELVRWLPLPDLFRNWWFAWEEKILQIPLVIRIVLFLSEQYGNGRGLR